jgi:hypothetical protein
MDRNELSADAVLLIYLGVLVSILVCFVSFMYWMMQPTVLAVPVDTFIATKRPPAAINALPRSVYESERLSIAVAEQENDRQGLQGLASEHPVRPSPSLAKDIGPQSMKIKRAMGSRQDRSYPLHSRPVAAPANPFGFFGWIR